jgi:hypothetical protein
VAKARGCRSFVAGIWVFFVSFCQAFGPLSFLLLFFLVSLSILRVYLACLTLFNKLLDYVLKKKKDLRNLLLLIATYP